MSSSPLLYNDFLSMYSLFLYYDNRGPTIEDALICYPTYNYPHAHKHFFIPPSHTKHTHSHTRTIAHIELIQLFSFRISILCMLFPLIPLYVCIILVSKLYDVAYTFSSLHTYSIFFSMAKVGW